MAQATDTVEVQTEATEEATNPLEGHPALADMSGQLLDSITWLVEFNKRFVESDNKGKSVHDRVRAAKEAAEDEKSPDAEALKLINKLDDLQSKLTKARQDAANYGSKLLGIEVVVEAPKPSSDELEDAKARRVEAVNIAKVMAQIAEILPEYNEDVEAFLKANPIPGAGRKGATDVTKANAGAPKYRVNVTRVNAEGTEETAEGITKAVQAWGKSAPTAQELREAFENVNKDSAENSETATFEHGDYTYTVAPK